MRLCIQLKADHQRPVHPLQQFVINMADPLSESLLVDGSELFQKNYIIFLYFTECVV